MAEQLTDRERMARILYREDPSLSSGRPGWVNALPDSKARCFETVDKLLLAIPSLAAAEERGLERAAQTAEEAFSREPLASLIASKIRALKATPSREQRAKTWGPGEIDSMLANARDQALREAMAAMCVYCREGAPYVQSSVSDHMVHSTATGHFWCEAEPLHALLEGQDDG